jgi:hypothetical protein
MFGCWRVSLWRLTARRGVITLKMTFRLAVESAYNRRRYPMANDSYGQPWESAHVPRRQRGDATWNDSSGSVSLVPQAPVPAT